jgi:hypothetical protein
MEPKAFVSINEICESHHIQYSFIASLSEYGLVEITIIEDDEYIEQEQLRNLEKLLRLHYDLEINLQGIDAINHLLQRVSILQDEVRRLKNRLNRFEK